MYKMSLISAIDHNAVGMIIKITTDQSKMKYRTINDNAIYLAKEYCKNTGKHNLLQFFYI
jgi:hypothetical protein